jgi:hypothetical protein
MFKPLILIFLAWAATTQAQSVSGLLGAQAAGMGYASGTLSGEWAIFNNVAGLANQKEAIAAATYEVRPALPGGNRLGALGVVPFSFGTAGISFFRFGDALYNEQVISLGFANQIGNTSLGARLSYIQYRAEGFGTHGAIGINIGGITKITPQISIGAWAQNINQPKINFDTKEKVPVKLMGVVSFKPTEKFTLVTELEKDVLYPVLWKTGMEYIIHKKFFTRAGFNIQPNALFLGVGFQGWRFKIDYAFQGLTQLGSAHQASVSYRITSSHEKEK